MIAKTALAADPRSFQVALEERLADAEGSLARPGDVAVNLGDGQTLADLTVASPFGTACQISARLAGSPAAAVSNAYDCTLNGWRKLLDDHQLDPTLLVTTF